MASDPAADPELQNLFEKLDGCISVYQYKKALKFCADSTYPQPHFSWWVNTSRIRVVTQSSSAGQQMQMPSQSMPCCLLSWASFQRHSSL